MRGRPSFAVAAVAVLVTASACSVSHSSPSATYADAAQQPVPVPVSTPPRAQQQAQMIISAQQQIPPLQTAGTFCLAGIEKDLKDAAVQEALNGMDPTGGQAAAWTFLNLEGDQVTVQKEYANGQIFPATFDLGQIIYAILNAAGDLAGKYDPELAFQWKLFGLIGPAAVYCAEAALWLDGTVGGQIGRFLQKQFLNWPVGQQVLAGRGSAITGKWVLYRKLESCAATGGSNLGCDLSPMDVTIACTGTACTIIRTNASAGFAPWDHSVPLVFGQGVWQASGTEKWAAECDQAPVPGSGVAFALKVTAGQVVDGVWRAQGLEGSYTVTNVPTSCWPAGTSVEAVSTTPFSTPSQPAPAPAPVQSPPPSGQCVFVLPNQVDCTSSNPEITLEGENDGDTSGCTFSAQISWGDGSQQTVQYEGADGVPSFVANHTYTQPGTFSITLAPSVVSGACSTFNGSYTFTYG